MPPPPITCDVLLQVVQSDPSSEPLLVFKIAGGATYPSSDGWMASNAQIPVRCATHLGGFRSIAYLYPLVFSLTLCLPSYPDNPTLTTLPRHPADFGLCELLDPGHTHVSNHNKGTPFYAAPETVSHSQVSDD